MDKIDCVVIGAGVIGLAAGRALALQGREVIVAESENRIGSVTSARNSGVIHAGIYYPRGSAKAQYCVRGREMLYAYARERGVKHDNCGKLIVAVTDDDNAKLASIIGRANDNGVHDLRRISREEALELEPELECTGALLSPSTGIIDAHDFLAALAVDLENAGGNVALKNTVISGEITPEGIILRFESGDILARSVINAAGLGAQDIASRLRGLDPATIPAQHLAKGNYFSLTGKVPFSRLVYPVPVPGGLGVHYTMNMAGEGIFGPDVEWMDNRPFRDIDYNVDETRRQSFADSISRYWPGIRGRTLAPAYSGVRPKVSARGAPDGDFILQTQKAHGVPGLVNLYGIESPGLTSSLAIAADIASAL